MELKILKENFAVCKVEDYSLAEPDCAYFFISKTDEENSLVCPEENVPKNAYECENGWRAFRIQGVLDFSVIGILSKISAVLAENKIGIFAISTYNTDYIFVKKENFEKACESLKTCGYKFIN